MKTCPNCHSQVDDHAAYCPVCGNILDILPSPAQAASKAPTYVSPEPEEHPYDHTDEFTPQDIADHKLLCMLVYLLDFVGMILALMAAKESEYTAFHMKQSMKMTILESLLLITAFLLSWTVIVPVLATICFAILLILKLIAVYQVSAGKSVEPAIIRSMKFLK